VATAFTSVSVSTLHSSSLVMCQFETQHVVVNKRHFAPLITLCASDSSRDDLRFQGIKRLLSLENWDRGLESHTRHGCLRFCCISVLCVGSGLATSRCPVCVLPIVCKIQFQINSGWEQVRGLNSLNE
jgi:hypothetical protein